STLPCVVTSDQGQILKIFDMRLWDLTLVLGKKSPELRVLAFRFFKILPGVPGTFPVLFCRPSLGLQQMEISRWLSVHGKMSNGGERVIDQPLVHLLAIQGVGRGKIVRVAVNSFPQQLD